MLHDAGVKQLAAAVLVRAIKDVNARFDDGPPSKQARKDIIACAKEFLTPADETFRLFCDVLDYEPEAVAEAAKRRGRIISRPKSWQETA